MSDKRQATSDKKQECGRSLIEVIGVMAIGALLTIGVIATFNIVRTRQMRTVAGITMENIVRDVRLLFGARGNYNGVSVDYLIKAGALRDGRQPIGAADWSIEPSIDGNEFLINLTGLSNGDCAYWTTVKLDWAAAIRVNSNETSPGDYCMSSDNYVTFIVE